MWKHRGQVEEYLLLVVSQGRFWWNDPGMHSTDIIQPRGGMHAPCVRDERTTFAWALVLEARRRVRLAGVQFLPRNRQQGIAKYGWHTAWSFPVPCCRSKSSPGHEYGDSAPYDRHSAARPHSIRWWQLACGTPKCSHQWRNPFDVNSGVYLGWTAVQRRHQIPTWSGWRKLHRNWLWHPGHPISPLTTKTPFKGRYYTILIKSDTLGLVVIRNVHFSQIILQINVHKIFYISRSRVPVQSVTTSHVGHWQIGISSERPIHFECK